MRLPPDNELPPLFSLISPRGCECCSCFVCGPLGGRDVYEKGSGDSGGRTSQAVVQLSVLTLGNEELRPDGALLAAPAEHGEARLLLTAAQAAAQLTSQSPL